MLLTYVDDTGINITTMLNVYNAMYKQIHLTIKRRLPTDLSLKAKNKIETEL